MFSYGVAFTAELEDLACTKKPFHWATSLGYEKQNIVMRSGDTLIGTTSPEPSGRQEADKDINRSRLRCSLYERYLARHLR